MDPPLSMSSDYVAASWIGFQPTQFLLSQQKVKEGNRCSSGQGGGQPRNNNTGGNAKKKKKKRAARRNKYMKKLLQKSV